MASFIHNITLNTISRILIALFSALSTIIIARAFGPVGKGVFTMAAFLPSLALNFGHFGLGNANTYFVAQDKEKTKKSFYNSFWLGLIIGYIFIVVFALLYRFYPEQILGKGDIGIRYFLLSLFTVPFVLWENFYQGIFVGKQEFKFFNLVSLLSKVLLFIGLILFACLLKLDMRVSVIYYLLLMILPAVIYTIYFFSKYGFPIEFDKEIFKQTISYGFRSYLACLLAFLILRSDIYILNYFRGLEEVGLYSLAVGFCDGILLLVSSITLVLFPKITENQEQALDLTLKVCRITSFIVGLIILICFIFGKLFISLIFGNQFLASLPAFYILLPAAYFWSLISFLTQFLASKGIPWPTVYLWLPGVCINIILNIIFIPQYGIVAAALTSLIAYFVTFILYFIYLQTFNKIHISNLVIPRLTDLKSIIQNIFKKYENQPTRI